VAVATALVAILFVRPASAAALDQSQTDFGGAGGGFTIVSSDQTTAETFTAGLSGSLTQISVHIGSNGQAPTSLVAEIRPTITGTALVFGGNFGQTTTLIAAQNVLATEPIPASSIPSTAGWVTVTFASPATVAAGTRYALVLRGTTIDIEAGTSSDGWTQARGPNGSDLYPAGQQFSISSALATWSEDDLTSTSGSIHDDFLFQTFVSPIAAQNTPAIPGGPAILLATLLLACGLLVQREGGRIARRRHQV
jgi:hypothetical protein